VKHADADCLILAGKRNNYAVSGKSRSKKPDVQQKNNLVPICLNFFQK